MRKSAMVLLMVLVLAPGLAMSQSSPSPVKVGVVDQDRVLNDCEEGRRLKVELEKLRDAKAATIEAKEKEIKDLQDQLLNAQLSMGEEKREEISAQLKRRRVEYERLNDDATVEFQDAANRAQKKLLMMFREVIKSYGAEKGYTAILEKNTIYYFSDQVDITEELLARFNQATAG